MRTEAAADDESRPFDRNEIILCFTNENWSVILLVLGPTAWSLHEPELKPAVTAWTHYLASESIFMLCLKLRSSNASMSRHRSAMRRETAVSRKE